VLKRALAAGASGVATAVLVLNVCILGGYLITSWEVYEIVCVNAGHLVGIVAGAILGGVVAGRLAVRGANPLPVRVVPLVAPGLWIWIAVEAAHLVRAGMWPERGRAMVGLGASILSAWCAWYSNSGHAGTRTQSAEGSTDGRAIEHTGRHD